MITLKDYFAPLLPFNIIFFILFIFFFDILGYFIVRKVIGIKETAQSRLICWLLGLGLYIFIWFILSSKISVVDINILPTVGILLLLTLPYYLRNKAYVEVFKIIKSLAPPLLIILPFLPSVFIKASLPPYYSDEMAYHFIAPAYIGIQKIWTIGPGLYENVPRLIDAYYLIVFALTKSYAVARLTNFAILFTAISYTYLILRKYFSAWVGAFFVLIFFSLPQFISFTSTLGFVDVPAYSFLLLGLILAIESIVSKDPNKLVLSVVLLAMNLGTKYTGITSIIPLVLSITVVMVTKLVKLKINNKRILILLLILPIIYGGYWYIKNLIAYGNPIFPFFFDCYRYSERCGASSGFFGSWTTKVTWANLYLIFQDLLPKSKFLIYMIPISLTFSLFSKSKLNKLLTVFLLLNVAMELLILSRFSGFLIRYHQHMQFFLILSVVLQIHNRYKYQIQTVISKILYIILFIFVLVNYLYTIKFTNSYKTFTPQELQFAIRKIDIYQWIEYKMPEMNAVVGWCEKTANNVRMPLARFDPDMIWYSYNGFVRSFIANCYFQNPPLEGIPLEQVISQAMEKKLKFWFISTNPCTTEEIISQKRTDGDSNKLYLRKLNNVLVCNSEQILPNLYLFDYSKN